MFSSYRGVKRRIRDLYDEYAATRQVRKTLAWFKLDDAAEK